VFTSLLKEAVEHLTFTKWLRMPGHTDPDRIEKDTLDSIDAKHSNWETLYEKGCLGLNMNFAYGKSVSIELDGPEISKKCCHHVTAFRECYFRVNFHVNFVT